MPIYKILLVLVLVLLLVLGRSDLVFKSSFEFEAWSRGLCWFILYGDEALANVRGCILRRLVLFAARVSTRLRAGGGGRAHDGGRWFEGDAGCERSA